MDGRGKPGHDDVGGLRDLRIIVVPGLLEEARVPEFFAARLLLLRAEDVRLADLHRHVLAVGVLPDASGERAAPQDVLSDNHHSMRLEERRWPLAHAGGELLAHWL